MILSILLTIYLLSGIISWHYVRKGHSKGGKYYGSDTTSADFGITICPVLNTIDAVVNLFSSINFNKFFNIKK